ncbi:hypothetical protein XBP1_2160011 [Xenorhabdus bovienii str. puntauvense]|uniref:Uncharacterized protein n=3 Tax=Xenorhabdus bovienii TaxID=40576 RepID=A0A0B6X5C1_XENBV|nr:hypothetical protein XBFFR1_2410006 [Xenorhabdus bovienii str. feltiae France]CDG93620.1 hypothetical protein XBFFL1_2570004 [Xenorhabdus bovienii str. feltiae Florida]CDG96533.1 hypothetical protein XBP1_2160011 [Xenorhabdus bovienii str. puntauvense]CDH00296.1 hypothetical protein XBFM1_150012 [Xenorhabdus bovienii str. feltiae Moldova]CDM87559.1 conserved protein of unknown function [Xenorhabdus bovienii]
MDKLPHHLQATVLQLLFDLLSAVYKIKKFNLSLFFLHLKNAIIGALYSEKV